MHQLVSTAHTVVWCGPLLLRPSKSLEGQRVFDLFLRKVRPSDGFPAENRSRQEFFVHWNHGTCQFLFSHGWLLILAESSTTFPIRVTWDKIQGEKSLPGIRWGTKKKVFQVMSKLPFSERQMPKSQYLVSNKAEKKTFISPQSYTQSRCLNNSRINVQNLPSSARCL